MKYDPKTMFYLSLHPIQISLLKFNLNYSKEFYEDRIGIFDKEKYEIRNPDGIWDYYDTYFYFPSEEALIIFKMKYK